MRHDMRNKPLRLLVVGLCLCLYLLGGTSPSVAVEVLDTFAQQFQTIGARYQQLPVHISPDCTYVVPIRYNFGQWTPQQSLRMSLFGPGRIGYWEVNIPATYWWGADEVAVDVPPWVPTGSNAAWEIGGFDYLHQIEAIFDQTGGEITIVQLVPNFEVILPGIGWNHGWGGGYGEIGCSEDEVEDCTDKLTNNIVTQFFNWILGSSLTVNTSVTTLNGNPLNPNATGWQKKLAGRLRAYKLYKGLEVGNSKMGYRSLAGVGAKERMAITSGAGYGLANIMDGYTVQGEQRVSSHPPGWDQDNGKVVALGDFVLDPVMAACGYTAINVGGDNYGLVGPCSDWGRDYGDYSSSSDSSDYADDDGGANERIDIDFSVTYNDNANTITVAYGAAGTASYPIFYVCEVSLTGGSSGSATFNADGDAIEMEFALAKMGVAAECPPEGHPCWHGKVETNMGIIMKVTYPTPDSVLFVFSLDVAAGAHGELWYAVGSQSYEICTTWSKELGRWGYDVSRDEAVQLWIDDNNTETGFNLPDSLESYSQKVNYILRYY